MVITLCVIPLVVGSLCSCQNSVLNIPPPEETSEVQLQEEIPEQIGEFADVKTLGDLENMGYEYQYYISVDSTFRFYYLSEEKACNVILEIPKVTRDFMHNLSVTDDYYNERWTNLRRGLTISKIEPISELVERKEEK